MPQIVLDGKYRLDERLGEGATGVVYRALHLGLKKTFAVKLLKRGALRTRFRSRDSAERPKLWGSSGIRMWWKSRTSGSMLPRREESPTS